MAKSRTKKIYHAVGKAIHEWGMILENERILLGVSGGKDSQALLKILFSLKARAPVNFEILPVYIDSGFKDSIASQLKTYINENFGRVRIEYTDYGIYAHSKANKENPCFLCSWLRRKKFFQIAKEEGCQKIALGHNKDDLIETFFINILYAGKTGTMKPKQSFFDGDVEIIRPLAYVEKKDIISFNRVSHIPEFINSCPSANKTKRSDVSSMLETLYKENRHVKGNIFNAMGNIADDYLLDKK